MTFAPQSSPLQDLLPAFRGLVLASCLGASLAAQAPQRTITEAPFHKEPGGVRLGTLGPKTQWPVSRAQGDWIEATVGGWLFTQSTGAAGRDGYDLAVTAEGGENLRAAPDANAAVLGHAVNGALFKKLGARGRWTQVTRSAWLPRRAFPQNKPTAKVSAPSRPDSVVGVAPGAPAPPHEAASLLKGATIVRTPSGAAVATSLSDGEVRVVQRTGDWAKIEVTGWVRSSELGPARLGTGPRVTPSDLRTNPERYVGQIVIWRLQFLALQSADALRPEVPEGQQYVLARGPLPEAGFVYLIVTKDQAERFKQMQPLDEFDARARVRAAKTRYLPNPVLEWLDTGKEGQR